MANKIRVVALPVAGPVAVVEIDDNLEALQKAVGGGYIETLPIDQNGTVVVCDEEGLLKGLPLNPNLRGIVGDAFITQVRNGDFVSLTEAQCAVLVTQL